MKSKREFDKVSSIRKRLVDPFRTRANIKSNKTSVALENEKKNPTTSTTF